MFGRAHFLLWQFGRSCFTDSLVWQYLYCLLANQLFKPPVLRIQILIWSPPCSKFRFACNQVSFPVICKRFEKLSEICYGRYSNQNLFYNYLSFIYFLPTESESHEILVHGPDIFGRAHLTFCIAAGLFTLQEMIPTCNPGANSLFAEGTTAQGKIKDV